MASESDKKPEIDNPTGEIDKNVKRSGVFDKIKKDALDELQEMVKFIYCFFRLLILDV